MGLQLIFCVETNKKCKSDYIYIKNTIDRFFAVDNSKIRLSPVYMDGKGNFASRKVKKEIDSLINQYSKASKNNRSVVIMCLDCDDYDIKPEDKEFLSKAENYCKENGFRFVWFCKDIEHVYLGKRISDQYKDKEATTFAAKKQIEGFEYAKLRSNKYQNQRSNLGIVLEEYLELKASGT